MNADQPPLIFLSHSGRDHDPACALARRLEKELAAAGHVVRVFNTSDPEHRFKELAIRGGSVWRDQIAEYEGELREYLLSNLLNSVAYILLVSWRSLQKESPWVAFEIETAHELAGNRRVFFLPAVLDGAWSLPGDSKIYQGVDLAAGDGFARLMEALVRAFHN